MIISNICSSLGRTVRTSTILPWSRQRSLKACSTQLHNSPRYSSSIAPKKPYYVTTPIFYVNAAPHVGHLYTMVLADILKRWQVLKGEKAILCTGTDEHGMKIQQAAAQANTPPKEFCDLGAETFKKLVQQAGLDHDHFVRTTDEDHKQTVQYLWQMLQEREYIYASKHEGWYCVSDETFYPESAIEKKLDPRSGRTFMASQETGKEVEWTSEANYHFRLSAFKDRLLQFYSANPNFIVPRARMNDVIKWVTDGLEDLSISRPVSRLSWGIRVPDDDEQTIYVWLDALVNYITKAGYPWAPGQANVGGWPANVQVIGKDIVRFHCIYWPAFLLALDIEPPKQILTHAHWTMDHQKMSKSVGNVVNPFFAIERFGTDTMRFYLAHDGGILDDRDYGNQYIVERYKKCLQGGLGNLVSRITRPTSWNVRECVESAAAGTMRGPDPTTIEQIKHLQNLREQVSIKMRELDPGAALKTIMEAVYQTNKYIQVNQPWEQAKLGRGSEGVEAEVHRKRCERTVYHCAEGIRIVGILLQPFMPEKAGTLLDMLGVHASRRTFADTYLGKDKSYGTPFAPPGRTCWDALFPPLSVET